MSRHCQPVITTHSLLFSSYCFYLSVMYYLNIINLFGQKDRTHYHLENQKLPTIGFDVALVFAFFRREEPDDFYWEDQAFIAIDISTLVTIVTRII